MWQYDFDSDNQHTIKNILIEMFLLAVFFVLLLIAVAILPYLLLLLSFLVALLAVVVMLGRIKTWLLYRFRENAATSHVGELP
jgi:membrane protein YdbS with pleckstrin-like domain